MKSILIKQQIVKETRLKKKQKIQLEETKAVNPSSNPPKIKQNSTPTKDGGGVTLQIGFERP